MTLYSTWPMCTCARMHSIYTQPSTCYFHIQMHPNLQWKQKEKIHSFSSWVLPLHLGNIIVASILVFKLILFWMLSNYDLIWHSSENQVSGKEVACFLKMVLRSSMKNVHSTSRIFWNALPCPGVPWKATRNTQKHTHVRTHAHTHTHRLRLVQDSWDGRGRTKWEQIQDLSPKRVWRALGMALSIQEWT